MGSATRDRSGLRPRSKRPSAGRWKGRRPSTRAVPGGSDQRSCAIACPAVPTSSLPVLRRVLPYAPCDELPARRAGPIAVPLAKPRPTLPHRFAGWWRGCDPPTRDRVCCLTGARLLSGAVNDPITGCTCNSTLHLTGPTRSRAHDGMSDPTYLKGTSLGSSSLSAWFHDHSERPHRAAQVHFQHQAPARLGSGLAAAGASTTPTDGSRRDPRGGRHLRR